MDVHLGHEIRQRSLELAVEASRSADWDAGSEDLVKVADAFAKFIAGAPGDVGVSA